MSREVKPQIYYLARRGWHEQLLKYCDGTIQKKGKDPITVFWKAYALGMMGNTMECKRQLDSFSQRRDLALPVTMSLLYFNRKSPNPDREVISSLTQELAIAEDVTKEAGLILAARFSHLVKDFDTARRITQKLLASCRSSPQTAFELEAQVTEHWCTLDECLDALQSSSCNGLPPELTRQLQTIDACYRGRTDGADVDALMCYSRSRLIARNSGEALSVINQCIATYSSFVPSLAEKAALLSSAGEWDQALDAAQRVLDIESDNIDALRIIALHSFTQESQISDSVSKLDDVEVAIRNREPSSPILALETAQLFSSICCRQTKPLMACLKILERGLKNCTDTGMEARILCQIGQINVQQGVMQYENAMKSFKEASKRDANCVAALEGLLFFQISSTISPLPLTLTHTYPLIPPTPYLITPHHHP